ncbi:MAG TPA: hypothetical protein VM100_01710 [Longimicrobiales bacterium]|nr:hypothetical protein [Longimicrobiales bacterium]
MNYLFRIILVLVVAASIWGLYSARRKKAAERSVAEAVTLPSPVVGFAIEDSVGQWCVVTTRADVKPGWNLRIFWPHQRETVEATLGEPRTACIADTMKGERTFTVVTPARMPSSDPALVLGMVSWSLSTKDSAFVGEFDNKPGDDRIAACSDDEFTYIFVVNRSPAPEASFYRRLPHQVGFGDCKVDLEHVIAERMPVEPLLYPAWAYRVDRYSPRTTWMMLSGNALAKTDIKEVVVDGACSEKSKTIAPTNGVEYIALFGNLPFTEGPIKVATTTPPIQADGYADPDSTLVVFGGVRTIVRRAHGAGIHVAADSSPLFDSDFEDEGRASVEWAGDLDRDGKVDLLMSITPKYSVRALQLFLSKQRVGASWPLAAEYSQAGC